ncbi:MAG: DUF4416 family protein [Candidatus Omnitrophota bacterium]
MGRIKNPSPVKLIAGFIFQNKNTFTNAKACLLRQFGKADFESPRLAFNYTDYYKKEIGDGLYRKFLSFEKLIDPSKLAEIKIFANRIEKKFSKDGCRRINIDPGYLDLAKLVLATTKDYSHRIYLKKGIYAEITLSYQGKDFRPLPWTYPDYQTAEYIRIFNQIRGLYARQTNLRKD